MPPQGRPKVLFILHGRHRLARTPPIIYSPPRPSWGCSRRLQYRGAAQSTILAPAPPRRFSQGQNRAKSEKNEILRGGMSSAGGPRGLKMSARVIRIILCILFLEENENLHPVLFSLGFGV